MYLTRKEINMYGSIISALNYRNLAEMEGQDDEAIYDLSRVLDNKYLRRRAIALMEFVQFSNYESIYSRSLWKIKPFCQDVYSLMLAIDKEVNKLERLEHKIDSMHVNVSPDIGETPKKPFKIDGRWKESTVLSKYREYNPEANEWCDEDILIELGLYVEPVYEDSGMTNEKYTAMLKERRQ